MRKVENIRKEKYRKYKKNWIRDNKERDGKGRLAKRRKEQNIWNKRNIKKNQDELNSPLYFCTYKYEC